MKDAIVGIVFALPFVLILWHLLSEINVRRYRVKQRSETHFVVQYLSPVGWRDTVAGGVEGDGWTYTVKWPHCFKTEEEAKNFICKQRTA